MDAIERHHFWFALGVALAVLACVAIHAVASDAGLPIVGLVVGNYLGKTSRRTYGAGLNIGET